MNNLKLVHWKNDKFFGRCTYCDARNLCGPRFKCKASMNQRYIDIKKERKEKLLKINGTL